MDSATIFELYSQPAYSVIEVMVRVQFYSDDVYGKCPIRGGLLGDLVRSSAIRRLQQVSQAGASSFVRAGRSNTRYEHSLGVMSLTGILGGSEIEQAAGLLQDLSHTAFSHTIDYLFDDRGEGFHERIFHEVIENSDIPEILERYDLTWQSLFVAENLRRVDVSAPLLCADRIDYTLRDLVRLGDIAATDARAFVRQLTFREGIIVSTNVDLAYQFVEWYAHLVGDVFMNPLELFTHDRFSNLLRRALNLHVISESDLMTTDQLVLSRILADDDHGLPSDLASIRRTRNVALGEHPRAVRVFSKGRKIDPPVFLDGKTSPLSQARPKSTELWASVERVSTDGILVYAVDDPAATQEIVAHRDAGLVASGDSKCG